MTTQLNRRNFLATSTAAGIGLLTAGRLEAAPFETTLHKALIGSPTERMLTDIKAAGFEGIESNHRDASPEQAAAARKVAERIGIQIHSLLRGWMNFNSSDADTVAKDVAAVATALRAAEAYGADNILLVPCRISGMPMPEAWEFDIELDEKKSHVLRVAPGDNSKYQAYIDAQNHATDATREAVKRLIPVAEKTGVVIALENVWNNLWVKPALFKHFIASFDSPWVQAYFDIGNHVKYAPPEEWIRTLGKLIVKCHVKDFQLNPDGHGGKFVDIRDGSVNWPLVRRELDAIGYNGWMTIEGSRGLPLEEQNKRLDLILAGK